MNRFLDSAPELRTSCSSSASVSSMGMTCCGVLTPTTMAVSVWVAEECKGMVTKNKCHAKLRQRLGIQPSRVIFER